MFVGYHRSEISNKDLNIISLFFAHIECKNWNSFVEKYLLAHTGKTILSIKLEIAKTATSYPSAKMTAPKCHVMLNIHR